MNENRRKQLIVDHDLQMRIIVWITWPPVVCLTVAMLGLTWFAKKVYDYGASVDIVVPGLVPVLLIGIFFLFASTAFIVYHALYISHHVAGPAYRMKRDFERVRAGDHAHRVMLRKGDFLVDLADDANALLEYLEQRVASPREGAEQDATPAEPARASD